MKHFNKQLLGWITSKHICCFLHALIYQCQHGVWLWGTVPFEYLPAHNKHLCSQHTSWGRNSQDSVWSSILKKAEVISTHDKTSETGKMISICKMFRNDDLPEEKGLHLHRYISGISGTLCYNSRLSLNNLWGSAVTVIVWSELSALVVAWLIAVESRSSMWCFSQQRCKREHVSTNTNIKAGKDSFSLDLCTRCMRFV